MESSEKTKTKTKTKPKTNAKQLKKNKSIFFPHKKFFCLPLSPLLPLTVKRLNIPTLLFEWNLLIHCLNVLRFFNIF